MFWKRKKAEAPVFHVELDDRRSFYRVRPHEKCPVSVEVNGVAIKVIDIGAGGMAFRNTDCRKDEHYSAVIRLSGYNSIFSVEIRVLGIDEKNICHCCFTGITEKDTDAIHQYVLEVQKEQIKEKKARAQG